METWALWQMNTTLCRSAFTIPEVLKNVSIFLARILMIYPLLQRLRRCLLPSNSPVAARTPFTSTTKTSEPETAHCSIQNQHIAPRLRERTRKSYVLQCARLSRMFSFGRPPGRYGLTSSTNNSFNKQGFILMRLSGTMQSFFLASL